MKRLFVILVAVLLLFAGCAKEVPEEPVPDKEAVLTAPEEPEEEKPEEPEEEPEKEPAEEESAKDYGWENFIEEMKKHGYSEEEIEALENYGFSRDEIKAMTWWMLFADFR